MPESDPFSRLRELSEPGAMLDPELLARLIDALPDAIVIIDEKGTIRLVNSQSELVFGYHRSELLGKPVEMLLPEPLREKHVGHRREFFMDPHVRPMGLGQRLSGRHRSGAEIILEINLSPIMTPQGPHAVAIVRKSRHA